MNFGKGRKKKKKAGRMGLESGGILSLINKFRKSPT